jgi:hypothetical protein
MVFIVGQRLMDWQVSNRAAKSPVLVAAFLRKVIASHKPDVVVTEKPSTASHKGERTKALIAAMCEVAADHELLDIAVERPSLFPNKYAEAEALAARYPELAAWKPKPRRFFDNEPRNTVLFEALALGDFIVARQ